MSSSVAKEVTKLNHSLSLSLSFTYSLERESHPAVCHNSANPLLASFPPSAASPAQDQSVYFSMNVWRRWKWRSIGCGFVFQDLTCDSTCTHTSSLFHSHATSQMDWNNKPQLSCSSVESARRKMWMWNRPLRKNTDLESMPGHRHTHRRPYKDVISGWLLHMLQLEHKHV